MTLIDADQRAGHARRAGVLDWLGRLGDRAKILMGDMRESGPHRMDPLRGLYLSDADVDEIIDRPVPEPLVPAEAIELLTEARQRLGLDPADFEILLVAAAPDIDRRYEQIYGYLNDDLTIRHATVALALLLAGLEPTDPDGRRRLMAGSPLVARGLVQVGGDDRSFLSRKVTVPDRVVGYLLGDDLATDARLRVVRAPSPIISTFSTALAATILSGTDRVYVRQPNVSTGMWHATSALYDVGSAVVVAGLDEEEGLNVLRAACLEAVLSDAGLVIGPIESVAKQFDIAMELLAALERPVVMVGVADWVPGAGRPVPLVLDAPAIDDDERGVLWQHALEFSYASTLDPGAATNAFRLGPDEIRRAAAAATMTARYRGEVVTENDITAGARQQNAAGLGRLTNRIRPSAGWSDLVVPEVQTRLLRELSSRVRNRSRVLYDWGLRRGGGRGDGMTALFAGPSGTGKTLAAEVIAHDLGLDLHAVDVSTVVDKYIGETEKNLDKIFGEAEMVNTVLFFDEADALFGKRSEVRDARDRYANVEVAYLLQRMERFDGITILATNLRLNIDDAFARRLDLVVDFPRPSEAERRRLWEVLIGERLPTGSDVDLGFLADQFDLCGGDIRNAVATAAYLAAERGDFVEQIDLVRGVGREYRKLGRLCLESDFGEWHEIVDADSAAL